MAHIGGLGHGPVHENDPNRINRNNNEDINFDAILAEFEEDVRPKKSKKINHESKVSADIDAPMFFQADPIKDSIPGVNKNEKIPPELYKELNATINKFLDKELPNRQSI